jgi:glycosyltransferase involved in cell wall biosynthesis
MPEILLLCEYATLNGGERSMLATFGAMRAAGFTPVVLAPARGPLAEALAAANVETMAFDGRTPEGAPAPRNRLREELAAILRRRRPGLLHANSLAMGRLSGPVAAEVGVASLSHLRDILRLSKQAVGDLNGHRRLLAVSEATRDFHRAGGVEAEKLHVVYNGVDLEVFRPAPRTGYLHRELGLRGDAHLVGTIGQICLRKGQDVLVRAARQNADQLPNVHYLIVGERHSRKNESCAFEENLHGQLDGQVHFLGPREDVARLLGELTLLVHPARQEPLGRVLLEAAAAGTPVIATHVGGTAEIFPPELDAARLVPPDDSEALGGAIWEMLGDAALRGRLAANARRHVEKQFDIRLRVRDLLGHYEALVGD